MKYICHKGILRERDWRKLFPLGSSSFEGEYFSLNEKSQKLSTSFFSVWEKMEIFIQGDCKRRNSSNIKTPLARTSVIIQLG